MNQTPGTPSAADLEADGPRLLERLRRLVNLESPSRDAEASARINELLAAWWRAAGAEVTLHVTPAGTHLVAEVPGRGEPLLFVGHSDTVWPVGSLDGEVPWLVDGDTVAGPGVFDMKSGLLVMLEAVDRLRGRETQRRAVRVVVVCDEEIGSPESRPLLERCGQGVVAAIGFESPHPDGALKVGRRGSTRVRIAVTGKAAHAALDPDGGVSAIDELVDQLAAVRAITGDPTLASEVLCNSGTIQGGTRANVVSAHAEAELGLRFMDGRTEERVLSALRGLTPVRERAQLEVEILSHRPAWAPSAGDTAFAGTLSRLAAGLGLTLEGRPAAGAGDTNLVGSLGIPTVDGFGPVGAGAHAVTERASLASMHQRAELLAQVLLEF